MKKNSFKKLIAIALDWTRPKDPPMSLGHASILASLKQANISVIDKSWAVNHSEFKPESVVKFIQQHQSHDTAVALGAFIWNENSIQHILKRLKQENFPGPIILGGPQVSYTLQGIEKFYPQADIFIRGYAEDALVRLAQATTHETTSLPVIRGVHYAREPDLGLSATIALEKIPSPYLTGLIKPQPFVRWETQRGCPFSCAFCQHREATPTLERRTFSLSRIIEEAKWITDNPIIQDIAVIDPIFNSGSQYLTILNTIAEGKYSGKLALQCRAEMVTTEFLDAVQKVNLHGNIVLEFGLQTIHRLEQKYIDRPNNMAKISRILTEVKSRGIDCELSLIFGLPGQTVASFRESIDFCIQHAVPIIHAFPLMLLRGTPLYNAKEKLKLIESDTEKPHQLPRIQENIPHVIASPTFTYTEWKIMAKMAEQLEMEYNVMSKQNQLLQFFKPIDKGIPDHGILNISKNHHSHYTL